MKKFFCCLVGITVVLSMLLSVFPAFAEVTANPATEVMTKEIFVSSGNVTLPYRLYVPEGYSSEKDYSLLLHLHGAGNRGDNNESQIAKHTGLINRIINGETITYGGEIVDSSKEFIIVAPQCMTNYQWVDTSWSVTPDPSYKLDEVAQSQYMTAVVELIDSIKKEFNINSSRMYVTGLSMGGFGTWDLLMRYPNLFAAAIPMGGAGDTSKADVIKNTPVWTFHQMHDPTVAAAGTIAMVKALTGVGAEVKFTPYFDTYHDAWTKGYAEPELLQWLYSHTKVQDKTKVAFVGDSITYGAGVKERDSEAYVSIIAKKYGNEYTVGNFGVSATSALKTAKYPYIETNEYKESLEFSPDILCIMFGTNDIKHENWTEGKQNFESDYTALINSYKAVNPELKVYVCIPPKIFKENVFGERSPKILEEEGIPSICNVAKAVDAEVIDFFNATKDNPEFFTDFLHPNAEGNVAFADIISGRIFSPKIVTAGASDWAKGEIALSYAAGIMPENIAKDYQSDITRQEFCEMVVNMLPANLEAVRTAKFDDCENDAVAYAYSVGVVNGISDNEFAPEAKATREEMATMLYRAYKLIAPDAKSDTIGEFPDKALISDWAIEAVNFMNEFKIMLGDDIGNIMPNKNTTREEAVLLAYRAYCSAYYYGK